jgi:hypothetical protein
MYTKYKFNELTLTASSYNRKISIEIPMDSTANEVFEAFKTLMVGLTFPEGAFDDVVVNYFYENDLNKDE